MQIKSIRKNRSEIILDNINLTIKRNEIIGLVGESGSGKSMLGCAILDMVPSGCSITSGSIAHYFKSTKYISDLRGINLAMISQDPMHALNPLQSIYTQFKMILRRRFSYDKKKIKKHILNWIEKTHLHEIPNVLDRYPHQLSGGQMQRVMIAMAMSIDPDFIVADEITTGLDAAIKMEILNLLFSFQKESHFSVLLISHDIKSVSKYCDRVVLLKSGKTKDNSAVSVQGERISCENQKNFKNNKIKKSENEQPIILEVKNLCKTYGVGEGSVQALKKINLDLYKGETLGVIGESGSGKTTLVKSMINILNRESGELTFYENNKSQTLTKPNRKLGVVFQDSQGSLNPKMKIFDTLKEPLWLSGETNNQSIQKKILDQIIKVNLDKVLLDAFPHELSGGQRQRVAIARSLLLNPSIIVLDEPTSALDIKTQGKILGLLLNIQKQKKLSYVLISHDLEVIAKMADRITVLYKGRIVESGSVKHILSHPSNDYTKKLITSSLLMNV